MIEPRFDWIKAAARMNLERHGYLVPALFCWGREGFAIVGMEWPNDEALVPVLIGAVERARELAPTALAVMLEAWTVSERPTEALRPRDNPAARDCLVMVAVTPDRILVESSEYGRDDRGEVLWSEWQSWDDWKAVDGVAASRRWMTDLLRAALT